MATLARRICPVLLLWMVLSLPEATSPVMAQKLEWGGSLRGYQFLRLEEVFPEGLLSQPSSRRDTELWLLRLQVEAFFGGKLGFELQPLVEFSSPASSIDAGLAQGGTRGYLPLEHDFIHGSRAELQLVVDRLNIQIDLDGARLVAGRQAITWGVNLFWPTLDLFAPFSPRQVDRDYKPGVDALRLTLPLGNYSELDLVGAVLGPSLERDGAAGALLRLYLGSMDLGLMGGKFHRDAVVGAFVFADLRGTGLRGEVNWTQSGDPADRARDRRVFWRLGGGIDRQVTPSLSVSGEFFWNGYGEDSAAGYIGFGLADRILRGEVNGLGRSYTGFSANWQFHPLGTVVNTVLMNWGDPSGLWIPTLRWSTGDNSDVLLGTQVGMGRRPDRQSVPRSEYGSVASTFFAALQLYF